MTTRETWPDEETADAEAELIRALRKSYPDVEGMVTCQICGRKHLEDGP